MPNQVLFPLHEEMGVTSTMRNLQNQLSYSEFTCLSHALRHIDKVLAVQTIVKVEDVKS